MTTFRIEYRIKGYSLADAMRPDPRYGKRTFTCESELVGSDDIDAIMEAAIATPPTDRYEFFSIQRLPGGEIKFARDAKTPLGGRASAGKE